MNSNTTTTTTASAPAGNLRRIFWIVCLLIIIGLAAGYIPRWLARRHLVQEIQADSVTVVNVVFPMPTTPDFGSPLPAEVQAWVQAPIYARASGYLQKWLVDIGVQVTNGQVLAQIVTPELDEQLEQAQAEVAENRANLKLAQITADRWTELLKTASVSEQEAAEKSADLALKKAVVDASLANLKRLQDLKAYDLVTAPFDGIITERNTDIGQLISADAGRPLFQLSQTDPLRVYVRVPQTLIHAVAPGQKADITFQDLPGRKFTALVTRTAGAVDIASRTLQVELQLKNPKGDLFSGSYAQVSFDDTAAPSVLKISDNAIITRAQGVQVAVVDAGGQVHLRNITLGRDFGDHIEVLAGLTATDQVIDNPPDAISDGQIVKIAPPAETNPAK